MRAIWHKGKHSEIEETVGQDRAWWFCVPPQTEANGASLQGPMTWSSALRSANPQMACYWFLMNYTRKLRVVLYLLNLLKSMFVFHMAFFIHFSSDLFFLRFFFNWFVLGLENYKPILPHRKFTKPCFRRSHISQISQMIKEHMRSGARPGRVQPADNNTTGPTSRPMSST